MSLLTQEVRLVRGGTGCTGGVKESQFLGSRYAGMAKPREKPGPGIPGTGLLGLRERAEAVGARLETRALEPHGFELAVTAARVEQIVCGPEPHLTARGQGHRRE